MAATKGSQLTTIAGADTAADDLFFVVDVSDTTQGATGTTKNLTRAEAVAAMKAQDARIGSFSSTHETKLGHITITTTLDLDEVASQAANGQTAHDWGNHASAGYSTFDPASPGTIGGTTPGVVNATTVNTSGDITEQTSTAATAGNQQNSPKTRWIGSGWKTNATAAAQTVEFAAQVKPIQGAAAPTGKLALMHAINGAALSESWSLYSDGNWTEEVNGGRVGRATAGGAVGICIGRNDAKTVFLGSYGSMAAGVVAGSSGVIGFAGGDTVGTGTNPLDANGVYFKLDSAGVFKVVDNGGTNLRDIKLRNLIATNLIKNAHFTTATRPAFSNGDQFFDDDLDKLVVGGVAAWEVVTSV